MNSFYPLLILIFTCALTEISAQQIDREFLLDSVTVIEKRIETKRTDINIGTRVSTFGKEVIESNQTKLLSDLLNENSTVYIKSLGQGALATSSIRGTSSSHTLVNWNGININPAMSKSFDFSQIPVFFTDNVSLYHGSSHLGNGSGGLGGSINIGNSAAWNDPVRVKLFAEVASFGTYSGAADAKYGSNKLQLRTRVFYQQSDNDYRYLNKVLQVDPFYERRKEASYNQYSVMQELYLKTNPNGELSATAWIQHGERELPQPIMVNVTQHEKQKDLSFKYLIGYDFKKDKQEFSVKSAYLYNNLEYRQWYEESEFSSKTEQNRAEAFHLKGNYQYTHSSKFNLSGSILYNCNWVNASGYTQESVVNHITSLQMAMLWNANDHFSFNAQTMGELNDKKFAPTFSVGVLSRVLPKQLSFKTNLSYNYKFPSLNDLYWKPGGNPDLMPEKGISTDASIIFTPKVNESLSFKVDATYYVMTIDNWIMWLPTISWYWEPQNVQNVLSHGLELLTEANYKTKHFRGRIALNYAYSPSINRQQNFAEDDTYGKQLPYVPKHKGNLRFSGHYKKAELNYNVCHTGIRYVTSDESYHTNAYTIHNMDLGYHFKLRKNISISPKLKIENIFNAYYESTEYYPMPLRSISFCTVITL